MRLIRISLAKLTASVNVNSDDAPKKTVLMWESADTAIEQIKRKQYTDKTAEYTGEIILVGISYDAETKKHECIIEKIQK